MVNRIVKESQHGTVDELIKRFLFDNKEATFQQIQNYVKENEITYKDKRGLHYRLKKLIDENIIEKSYINGKPTYRLPIKVKKDPGMVGLMVKYEMIDQLEFMKIKMKRQEYWRFMILAIGFYSVYVETLSWQLFKYEKQIKKRLASQKQFLGEALPLRIIEGNLYFSEDQKNNAKAIRNFNKLSREFDDFEKSLKKSNGLLFRLCENVTNNVSKKLIQMGKI